MTEEDGLMFCEIRILREITRSLDDRVIVLVAVSLHSLACECERKTAIDGIFIEFFSVFFNFISATKLRSSNRLQW